MFVDIININRVLELFSSFWISTVYWYYQIVVNSLMSLLYTNTDYYNNGTQQGLDSTTILML